MTTRISNGGSNGAGERQPQQSNTRSVPALSGTGISFTNPATIADSGNGLGIFRVGDRIEVAGPTNRGRWNVVTASAGAVTVSPGRITTASAGATVSIRKVD